VATACKWRYSIAGMEYILSQRALMYNNDCTVYDFLNISMMLATYMQSAAISADDLSDVMQWTPCVPQNVQ